jgi:hypothetical protein
VHVRETPVFQDQWKTEETYVEVPRTTIREELKIMKSLQTAETEQVVDQPVYVPAQPHIFEKAFVRSVTPKFKYVKGTVFEHPVEEDIIEVPVGVEVPKVKLVEKPFVEERRRNIVVDHIHRKATAVPTPIERFVEKVVEVPQIHTVERIRYVPRLVYEERGHGFATHGDLDVLRNSVHELECQREKLSQVLASRVHQINELTRNLTTVQMEKVDVKSQLDTALAITSEKGFQRLYVSPRDISPATPTTFAGDSVGWSVSSPMYTQTPSTGTHHGTRLGSSFSSPLVSKQDDALFNAIDRNHDGVISRAEWRQALNNQVQT